MTVTVPSPAPRGNVPYVDKSGRPLQPFYQWVSTLDAAFRALPVAAPLAGIINASSFGAKGDGIANDTAALQAAINAAFVVTTSNAQAPPTGNKVLFIPPGTYNITAPLNLVGVFGAVLMGAGQYATQIINSAGTSVFITQGFQYNVIRDITLQGSGSAVVFELNWDGVNNCALQSNKFYNVAFGTGSIGVRIANSNHMGSENEFLDCNLANLTSYGLQCVGGNALSNKVIGGNIASCGTGIRVDGGSVPMIAGVGFQANTNWDIDIEESANDAYCVTAIRTQSVNFAKFARGNANVSGCEQFSGGSTGTFISSTFHAVGVYNCISTNGQMDLEDGEVAYCEFGRSDWASARHFSLVRGTYTNGTIDSTGYINYLFDGYWKNGAYFTTALGEIRALVDGATINTNAQDMQVFTVTLGGNRTLANPTNLAPGVTYRWVITQDATGSRTLAYGALFTWPLGTPPTLSTPAGSVDVIEAIYDGSKLRAALVGKAFA